MCKCMERKLGDGPYHVSLITLLQNIQQEHGYLPEEAMKTLSAEKKIPLIDLYTLVTFYKSFNLNPPGKHKVTVCTGTACHVRGSLKVVEELSNLLQLDPRGGTTPDGSYTLEKVNCLGACALAPLVTVDGEYHGKVTPSSAREIINTSREIASSKAGGSS